MGSKCINIINKPIVSNCYIMLYNVSYLSVKSLGINRFMMLCIYTVWNIFNVKYYYGNKIESA